MTIRTWFAAAIAVTFVALSAGPGLADARGSMERYQPAPTRSELTRIAQSRAGRMNKAAPAPAPARAKSAKLEPKPPADAARGSASADMRTGRASHR